MVLSISSEQQSPAVSGIFCTIHHYLRMNSLYTVKKMVKEQEELTTKEHEILPVVPICFSNLKNLLITSHMIFGYFLFKSIHLLIHLSICAM